MRRLISKGTGLLPLAVIAGQLYAALFVKPAAICALLLMPSMVYVFHPDFVLGKRTPAMTAGREGGAAQSTRTA